jgi:hypothetical protein
MWEERCDHNFRRFIHRIDIGKLHLSILLHRAQLGFRHRTIVVSGCRARWRRRCHLHQEHCGMIENTDAEQIERLNARIIELMRERDALRKAAQDFVDKVDRGEARSRQSYDAFKAALGEKP